MTAAEPEPAGRGPEYTALATALAEAAAGRGGLVIVTGESGIGKTHLLHALAERLLPHAPVPVTSAWVTASSGDPEVLRPWIELGRALARSRPGPAVSGLSAVLTERRNGPWTEPALDAGVERLWQVAGEGPLLLVVDDAHRLDGASVELLDRALATIGGQPVLLVLAGRCDGEGPLKLTALAEGLRGRARTRLLTLGPLPVEQLVGLARSRGAADLVVQRSVRASGGNPLLLECLLTAADDPYAWGRVSPSARALMIERVRAADETGVVAVLAVLDRPATTSLLAQTTGSDHASVDLALRAASAAGIVERSGRMGQYRLTFPLLRDAVVAAIDAGRIRGIHLDLARALRRDGGSAAWHRAEAARHVVASGTGGCEAASVCLEAALWEERAESFADAEELAAHGLDSACDDPLVEVQLLRVLGRCHGRAGRVTSAREVLERAVALARTALNPIEQARTVVDLAGVDLTFVASPSHRVGQLEEALRMVEREVLTDSTNDLKALLAMVQAMLSVALYFTDLPRSRLMAERGRVGALQSGDSRTIAVAHDMWAFAAVGTESAETLGRFADQWDSVDDVVFAAVSCSRVGPAMMRGDRGVFDFELARMVHHRSPLPSARARGLVTVVQCTRAMLDGDAAEVARLQARLQESQSPDVLALAAVNDLIWRLLSGQNRQPSPQTVAAVLPTPSLVQLFGTGSVVVSVLNGDEGAQEALRGLSLAREELLHPRRDLASDVSICLLGAVGGHLLDPELSRRAIDELTPYADEFAVIAWLICAGPVGMYLAWAHLGLGDLPAALAANARGEAACRRMSSRTWLAQCLLQRAGLLRAAGDAGARAAAQAALELAEELGLAILLQRAAVLLDQAIDAQSLPTGRNLRIIELAAEGNTNEQIARAMFLSVSTVERQLSQLYRILGVRNRAEAVARMRSERSRRESAEPAGAGGEGTTP